MYVHISNLHKVLKGMLVTVLTGMARKMPRPLVVCGPSGSGKSTLIKRILEEFPDKFGFSISHTTRAPRNGEGDGEHYHFVSRAEFESGLNNGEFVESATYGGNLYGTSKSAVRSVMEGGKVQRGLSYFNQWISCILIH